MLRSRLLVPLFLAVLLSGSASAQLVPRHRVSVQANSLAPYVVSPMNVVDRMLDLSSLRPGETLYDLGCGDGRVLITAARRFGAKAVGVELSPSLVKTARETVLRESLQEQVSVVEGNLLDADLSQADVVILYLMTESNDLLKPKLEKQLKGTARVVSHDFEIRGWKASKVEKVAGAGNRKHTIYVYEMAKH